MVIVQPEEVPRQRPRIHGQTDQDQVICSDGMIITAAIMPTGEGIVSF